SISSLAIADEAGESPDGEDEYEEGSEGENETEDLDLDNETEDLDPDNETVKQIEIMNNSLGAEIRLLQLEKAIIKNLLKGEMAVEVLKGLDYNTTALESILSEMHNLLEEVRGVNASSNDSVHQFVQLKNEAINLTRQFRERIKDLLDGEKLQQIRERIREMMSDELENCSKMIRNKIKQFNRNQLHKLYGLIGEFNNSFVNEYMNGNVTIAELKIQISKKINQMNRERKYEIFSELKEGNIKKKIHAQASIDEMKNKGHGKDNGKGNGKGK
ncbi:MAG: hypothetical protein JSU91_02225, partial [Thermoplasmatales archaeon]